eukprot:626974-Prorocentrum_minimum.AAC.4
MEPRATADVMCAIGAELMWGPWRQYKGFPDCPLRTRLGSKDRRVYQRVPINMHVAPEKEQWIVVSRPLHLRRQV